MKANENGACTNGESKQSQSSMRSTSTFDDATKNIAAENDKCDRNHCRQAVLPSSCRTRSSNAVKFITYGTTQNTKNSSNIRLSPGEYKENSKLTSAATFAIAKTNDNTAVGFEVGRRQR